MKKRLWPVLAFLTGLVPGFFLVSNFMFSDVASLYERVISYLVTAIVYLILGIAFGVADSSSGWKPGMWLSLSALIFVFLYSIEETGTLVTNLLYAASAFVFSVLGSWLGGKLSRKRKQ